VDSASCGKGERRGEGGREGKERSVVSTTVRRNLLIKFTAFPPSLLSSPPPSLPSSLPPSLLYLKQLINNAAFVGVGGALGKEGPRGGTVHVRVEGGGTWRGGREGGKGGRMRCGLDVRRKEGTWERWWSRREEGGREGGREGTYRERGVS